MSNKRNAWKLLPIVRVIAVLSAVGCVTSIVTFAALQSTGNALQGNTIQTASAKLQIGTDGTNFGDSVQGFNFTGIVPGGQPQPQANGGYVVYVKNTGDTTLALSIGIPKMPTTNGVTDLSKVRLLITPVWSGPVPTQTIRLSDLVAGTVAITDHAQLGTGNIQSFKLQVAMDADAVSGGSASITGLDIAFSGTAL